MSAAAPPTPNYVDPQLHGHVWLITSCIFLPIATFFVFARLWARIVVLRSPGIDDVLIVPALLCRWGSFVWTYLCVYKWYWNRHTIDVPVSGYGDAFRGIWVYNNFVNTFLLFTKCSILMFYIRILHRAQYKKTKLIIIATIVWVVGYVLVALFWYDFNCNPPESGWLMYVPTWLKAHDHHCGNVATPTMFGSIMNCVSDWWMAVIPILFIRSLQLAPSQKQALTIIFGLGFAVCGLSLYRTWIWHTIMYDRHEDVFWQGYYCYVWTDVELNIALVVACAPTLKSYLTFFIKDRPSLPRYITSKPTPRKTPGDGISDGTSGSDGTQYDFTKSVEIRTRAGPVAGQLDSVDEHTGADSNGSVDEKNDSLPGGDEKVDSLPRAHLKR